MTDHAYLGQIGAVAFDFAPKMWAWCDGHELPVDKNKPLFDILGGKYSDAAKTKFALPSMKGPMDGVRYVICVMGPYPPPDELRVPFEPNLIGMLTEWDSPRLPEGSVRADGATLDVGEADALYNLIGTTFGGSPYDQGTFKLPNLGGKWIIAKDGMYPLS
jgi:microcystin-dependent protein